LADVFISYARADETVARRVAKALEAAGLELWWDADLPAHRAYSEVIERNLDEAKAVVVLWSKTAAKSQWVRAEADVARNAGKLVQAQIDGTVPPIPFNQIQCADLKGWRGSPSQAGWAKLQASVEALVSGEERPQQARREAGLWDRIQPYRWAAAATLALIIAAGLFLYAFGVPGEEHKPVLAVLPFRSLDAQDESLVAGMWEDTRTAIGRNPQLIVLGPNTAQALADKGEGAARKAADYLLEASVRTAGDRIRVSANLVRTKNGEQVWSQDFDRKLDDVFALQSQIASEIEGRIRGRLAEKGGMTPEHIATSGDVYALYSDARAKVRSRDFGTAAASAIAELEQVVKLDPNYAPGWATLSEALAMAPPSQNQWKLAHPSEGFARKAIELAPNLAAAHAALAFALELKGPVARAEVERAVELDPNDYEALNWLAGVRSEAGDKKGALQAYTRAVEIEPLFWPAVFNKLGLLKQLHDDEGIQQLLDYEKRVGGDYFAATIEMDNAHEKGDLAKAVNLGLEAWKSAPKEGQTPIGLSLWTMLLQLGFFDEALKVSPAPDFAPYLWRNDPRGLDIMESKHIDPRTFFASEPLPENAGRVYILSGRSRTLADLYLSLKASPEEFEKIADDPENFLTTAPMIAIALKQSGHGEDAGKLLSFAETEAKNALKDDESLKSVLLARIYVVQGRNDEALALLTSAVNRGWLPQPPMLQMDLATDPALSTLKGDPRFEAARQYILGTIARERAQVNLSLLRQFKTA